MMAAGTEVVNLSISTTISGSAFKAKTSNSKRQHEQAGKNQTAGPNQVCVEPGLAENR